VWLELRVDHSPATRDVAGATRELALALVSRAMAARGEDVTARVCVVEGNNQGAALALALEGRAYVLGRGPDCDLLLSEADASRAHACVERQGNVVVVRDLGAKNGTWIGDCCAPANRDVVWRPAQMMRIGRTVLSLVEPVGDALSRLESAPDEELPAAGAILRPSAEGAESAKVEQTADMERGSASAAPVTRAPAQAHAALSLQRRTGFSVADIIVMATAMSVLVASIAGLLWLLRG
jgi:hypothetical protein